MKLTWVQFGLLLGLALVLVIILSVGETTNSHGFNHETIPQLQQGGSGWGRHGRLLWAGLAFGLLQIFFYVACLALGAQRQGQLGPLKWPLLIGGLIYSAIYSAMILAYRTYAAELDHSLVWIFPLPTALMLFGLWPAPALFIVLFIWGFDRWIMRPEDHERFRQIIAARRQREGGDG